MFFTKKSFKRNTKKTKKQFRHKLLGEGGYGCVYKPAFKCAENNVINNKFVSKVMENNDAREEYQNYELIDKIDPTAKYHIKLEKMCDLSNNNKESIIKRKECERVSNAEVANFKHIKFADGGKELYYYYHIIDKINKGKLKPNKENTDIRILYKILMAFKNIVKSLLLLKRNTYSHFDIKIENIVYDTNSNVMKLIDFGLAVNYNFEISENGFEELQQFTDENNIFFITYIMLMPFEVILFKYNIFQYAYKHSNDINKIKKKLKKTYKVFDNQNYNYMLENSVLSYYINLIGELQQKYDSIEFAYIVFVKMVFSKLDLYSVGIALLELMYIYRKLYTKKMKNVDGKLIKDFNELYKLTDEWLDGVLEPMVEKRWSISKAITEYNKIYNFCKSKV